MWITQVQNLVLRRWYLETEPKMWKDDIRSCVDTGRESICYEHIEREGNNAGLYEEISEWDERWDSD